MDDVSLDRISRIGATLCAALTVFSVEAFVQFEHYISGLIVSENKTVDGINRLFVTESRNQSRLNRLLTTSPFTLTDLDTAR